jgi:hypothetical protein
MRAEAKAGFVVIIRRRIVMEDPASMLGTAGLVHQVTDLLLMTPEAADAALLAVPLPKLRVSVASCIERSDELIAMM